MLFLHWVSAKPVVTNRVSMLIYNYLKIFSIIFTAISNIMINMTTGSISALCSVTVILTRLKKYYFHTQQLIMYLISVQLYEGKISCMKLFSLTFLSETLCIINNVFWIKYIQCCNKNLILLIRRDWVCFTRHWFSPNMLRRLILMSMWFSIWYLSSSQVRGFLFAETVQFVTCVTLLTCIVVLYLYKY